jgi:3-oxoacyl-[acyl-carrier protein] reductase
METFQNRVVLVSGATRGIGKAIARRFLEEGAYLVGLYAGNEVAAQSFQMENALLADRIDLRRCNVSDPQAVAALFGDLEQRYQSLDILVNNAGIRRDAVLAMMSYGQWQEVIDTNLTGTYLLAKHAVPLMMRNKFGRIINITSPVAHLGFPGQANYAASKAGQVAMTKSLAKEVARKKITVNCVSPGFIATDFLDGLSPELLEEYKKMVPMRRFGSPEEVAHAVLFLAGSEAAYISGTVLEVSGGL